MFAADRTRHANLQLALLGLMAIIGGLFGAPSVWAGQPDTVDPALMQPALNPSFGPWECWRADARIICEGSRTDTYAGLEVDFLSCAAGPIYSQGTITSTARRVGDADGRALETSFRDRYEEYFSSDPGGADPRLRSIGRLQHSFSYGVPGDPSTVSETLAGMAISVTGPGFGVVLHDVGTVAWDSNGELIRLGGVHPPAFSPEEWQATHDRICSVFESGY
jgi:hypothetical protein